VNDEPILSVEGLRVAIPSSRGVVEAVDGISFAVMPAEVVGIVGESGSGKSMLALSLLRLVPEPGRIVAGRIAFDGRDLIGLSEREMRHVRGNDVGMIFQDPSAALNPVMRVGRQISESIEAHTAARGAAAHGRAVEMLRDVRIPEPALRALDYPHQYSGGMRQRAVIAIGMVNRPKLLIADEPTTALDVTVQAQIMDLLRAMNAETGTAIILITHNIALVSRFCTRVLVMYAGRIVESGPTDEVFARPSHPYTRALISAVPHVEAKARDGLTAIEGRPPDLANKPSGCAFHPRCPLRDDICLRQAPPPIEVAPNRMARCWAAQPDVAWKGKTAQ
jgi:oligopeptide/dipeptide ABC transporter ATP-binding protein